MSSALEIASSQSVGQIQRTYILADALEQAKRQRELLLKYVGDHMRNGIDFGIIPGTPKPSLWKPGAEKIASLYRCTAKYKVTRRVEKWSSEEEAPLFHYEFKCRLVSRDTNKTVAEGIGSCNSLEPKYARRRDGSVLEPYGVVNTILKMAKKRSLVDAAIALGCCSDIFTQDLDDSEEIERAQENRESTVEGDFQFGWDLQQKKDGPVVHAVKGKWVSEVTTEALEFAINKWQWFSVNAKDSNQRIKYTQQLDVLKRTLSARTGNQTERSKTEEVKRRLLERTKSQEVSMEEDMQKGDMHDDR